MRNPSTCYDQGQGGSLSFFVVKATNRTTPCALVGILRDVAAKIDTYLSELLDLPRTTVLFRCILATKSLDTNHHHYVPQS